MQKNTYMYLQEISLPNMAYVRLSSLKEILDSPQTSFSSFAKRWTSSRGVDCLLSTG